MDIAFDAANRERNVAVRGISFEQALGFEWDSALMTHERTTVSGASMLVFTPRADKAHVVSLRKANRREVKRYEAQA